MKASHIVPCAECEKTFVSISHKTFHQHFSHKPLCPHCKELCEGYCSSLYSVAAEKVGGKIMEMTKQGIIDMISDTENRVEKLVESITANQLEALQYCANHIDTGHTSCDATDWAMLMYYPSPEMPTKKDEQVHLPVHIPRSLHVSHRKTSRLP